MGKVAAQKRHRHQVILYRDPQMEEYQVAAGLLRFVDRGCIVVYRGAHFVGGCGLDELPKGTAHGGTIINNKESRPALAGHRREKLLRFVARNNTESRIFPHCSQAPGLFTIFTTSLEAPEPFSIQL